MKFTIWGARGSHPVPLTTEAIRSKIATVIQRVRPGDLVSAESRERFLASLPDWLFGTTGGNTACAEVVLNDGSQIIFDAGTGIVGLGQREMRKPGRPREYHIFFTHFHYDHIQGLPFFTPAYDSNVTTNFYSPNRDIRSILSDQMLYPYFPVTMEDKMSKKLRFHVLGREGETERTVHGAKVRWRELNHPGKAYAYRVDHGGKSWCYCTDVELLETDFHRTPENEAFFGGLDVMILDTQYTLDEAIEKYNWGHTSFSLGVDFALTWGVRRLFLFHHEPQYHDRKLHQNEQSARWYANRIGGNELQVLLSTEGVEIDV